MFIKGIPFHDFLTFLIIFRNWGVFLTKEVYKSACGNIFNISSKTRSAPPASVKLSWIMATFNFLSWLLSIFRLLFQLSVPNGFFVFLGRKVSIPLYFSSVELKKQMNLL